MVSLCHGMIPHNSSLIEIACINMMRLIGIDSQMIVKAKIWILLYKDFVLSHSASLEEKTFCANFYVSFSLYAGNLSKR